MKRFINQMNVSITTNRTCNLHCTHCYIMPEMFKNKNRISFDNFKKIFEVMNKIKDIDTNLEEVEWETLGGETTLMPYEFWEEALPYALKEIRKMNSKLEKPGSMNYITNLMVKDSKYFDLFNKYGGEDVFSIYTSWEPDTERFGKNNEKLPTYFENIRKIDKVQNKTLDVIFTKKIIELGPKYIIDTFLPLGIVDFSFKMISPYGSGKEFFKKNMVDFKSMETYLKKLELMLKDNKNITFTPQDEILSSVYKNESFQCNGNFYYDLSIEPEGYITFNASQTLNEAVVSYNKTLDINEKNVEYKIMFENIKEAFNKLELKFDECDECEYLTYCNAGWYHYKTNKDSIKPYAQKSCSGLKEYWDFNLGNINMDMRQPKLKQISRKQINNSINENDISKDYEEYFEHISAINNNKTKIIMQTDVIFGKEALERILFYDALDIEIQITDELFNTLSEENQKILIKNIINYNYKIKVIDNSILISELKKDQKFKNNIKIINSYDQKNFKTVIQDSENIDCKLIEQYIFIKENLKFLKQQLDIKEEAQDFSEYDLKYLEHVENQYGINKTCLMPIS